MATRKLFRARHMGLRIVYEHIPGPLTAIALGVRAGSRFDGRHPGVAHVAEHMLFQGTRSIDQLALNRRAAELGGEHNADTGHEDIAITFEVFNSDVGEALELLAEQFYRTTVDPARLRKELRVVLDEIRGRLDSPVEYAYLQAWKQFFRGPLSHPVCGTVRSVRALRPRHVTAFLRKHFVHRNAVLAVVGGASRSTVIAQVRRIFRHDDHAPPPLPPPVRPGRSGFCRIRRSGASHSYIVKMIELPLVPRKLVATAVALDLIGSDPDGELFQAVRERHGLGYDVSSHFEWGPDWAVAILGASAGRGQGNRLHRVVSEVLEHSVTEGFSPDALQRARKKLRYRYASLAENRLERALAHAEGTLTGLPSPESIERTVRSLEREDIEAAWKEALKKRTLTVLLDT
ncbi:MAG: peptidase M16 [Candidatus Binatia bacterium]|nr:MAG: peptidase M16 [Candidatus Binatia bacterium]